MVKTIRVHEPGGIEVLQSTTEALGQPGEGEVLLRQTAIGVNLIDTYHRTATAGQYAIARPAILGVEAAGVVEALGPGVTQFKVGDRAAYWMVLGAYAEKRIIPAAKLVKLPDFVSEETAAAGLLKGVTAQYLLHRIYPVKDGDTVMVHAAAGGVGQLLCQWARHLGATVIGSVGSGGKKQAAADAGCHHVIVHDGGDFSTQVKALNGGRGVDVVYDSIGKDTFEASLNCLRPLGMMVSFGQASGAIPPLDISVLAQKGSVFLAKPTLATFSRERSDIESLARGFFDAIGSGAIRIDVRHRASLDEVGTMHAALEARQTTGPIVLTP
ncbi:quinone oxidoreductase [Parapusillimonas sp. SGNA-6]|nr:quinone oxidoreductase [Parapusillimonas sp. SGNA-6]